MKDLVSYPVVFFRIVIILSLLGFFYFLFLILIEIWLVYTLYGSNMLACTIYISLMKH